MRKNQRKTMEIVKKLGKADFTVGYFLRRPRRFTYLKEFSVFADIYLEKKSLEKYKMVCRLRSFGWDEDYIRGYICENPICQL